MKTVKVLLLSFLLCFGFANVFANNGKHIQIYGKDIYSTVDTAIVPKSFYKHGKKVFLEKYGRDDSCKALIDIFFSERRNGLLLLATYPVLVTLPVALNSGGLTTNQIIFSTHALVGIIGITGTATGIYILNSYTRKKLYVLLRDYQRNGYLPQKYSERVEQWVEETKRERLLKERKARLKKEKERLKEEGAKAQ